MALFTDDTHFVVYMNVPKPSQEHDGASLTVNGGKRSLMIAALRYDDTLVKQHGGWLFAERKLYVDWIEERALA